jgi:hypothetical protein
MSRTHYGIDIPATEVRASSRHAGRPHAPTRTPTDTQTDRQTDSHSLADTTAHFPSACLPPQLNNTILHIRTQSGGNFVLRQARVVRQPGDGSCLFHSMAYGLRLFEGGSTSATQVRAICNSPSFVCFRSHAVHTGSLSAVATVPWYLSRKNCANSTAATSAAAAPAAPAALLLLLPLLLLFLVVTLAAGLPLPYCRLNNICTLSVLRLFIRPHVYHRQMGFGGAMFIPAAA